MFRLHTKIRQTSKRWFSICEIENGNVQALQVVGMFFAIQTNLCLEVFVFSINKPHRRLCQQKTALNFFGMLRPARLKIRSSPFAFILQGSEAFPKKAVRFTEGVSVEANSRSLVVTSVGTDGF